MKLRSSRIFSCVAFWLIIGTVLSGVAFGCSYRRKPLASFDGMTVLIGSVTGYTERTQIPGRAGTRDRSGGEKGSWYETQGYRIAVEESLSDGQSPPRAVEVFDFFRTGTCEPMGLTEPLIEHLYPIGTWLAIVASPSVIIPRGTHSVMRFEVLPGRGTIGSISALPKEKRPTLSSIFDYGSNIYPNDIPFFLLRLEVLKDIHRIKSARKIADKKTIIERMAGQRDGWGVIDYYYLVRSDLGISDIAYYAELLNKTGLDGKRLTAHLTCLQKKYRATEIIPNQLRC